jgi:NAD(P)-dependent dehydrogenase (short-subunit alcohol dehydrogenase family)
MGTDIAKAVLAAGHAVVATGRDTERITEAVGAHDDLEVVKLDVTSAEDARAAAQAAVDRFGSLDVLVNNAGNFYAGFFEEITPEDFRAQVIAPFGIRTMIVEPGSFRTDLLTAGSTKYAKPSIEDYAERTEQTITAWNARNGKHGGDPAKLAAALVRLANQDEPPFRWPAGADSVANVERKANDLLAQAVAYRDVSSSLGHDDS